MYTCMYTFIVDCLEQRGNLTPQLFTECPELRPRPPHSSVEYKISSLVSACTCVQSCMKVCDIPTLDFMNAFSCFFVFLFFTFCLSQKWASKRNRYAKIMKGRLLYIFCREKSNIPIKLHKSLEGQGVFMTTKFWFSLIPWTFAHNADVVLEIDQVPWNVLVRIQNYRILVFHTKIIIICLCIINVYRIQQDPCWIL